MDARKIPAGRRWTLVNQGASFAGQGRGEGDAGKSKSEVTNEVGDASLQREN